MTDPIATRRHAQMFPTLAPESMSRVERFGIPVSFDDDQPLFTAGVDAAGLYLIMTGRVRIMQRDGFGGLSLIVEHGLGEFAAGVGQLSGGIALIDGRAIGPVTAVLLPPERLRALMVAEAALGEVILRALILRRASLIETGNGGPVLIGPARAHGMTRLAGFLTRNGYPYRVLDAQDDPAAATLLAQYAPASEDLPLVICHDGSVLRNPTDRGLAQAIGMLGAPEPGRIYDVAIVGAGPAGLATAVYAASEGLSVIVLDARAFGGQAGASARIENYFGFPTGISGQALVARAFTQAQKFGAQMAIPARISSLDCPRIEEPMVLKLDDGTKVTGRTVVIASGARCRRLRINGLTRFEGRGIWYWASPVEAAMCADQDVILVGGGNSAGQAAVYLAGHVRSVTMMVRARGLAVSVSRHLIDRIAALPNITLLTEAQITALEGKADLETVRWTGPADDDQAPIRHVFLFAGADPASDWLSDCGVA